MSEKDWIEEAENRVLFQGATGGKSKELLDYSETNRIVSDKMAKANITLLMTADYMEREHGEGWSWIRGLVGRLERYFLTLGEPDNSRKAYERVLTTELKEEKTLPVV